MKKFLCFVLLLTVALFADVSKEVNSTELITIKKRYLKISEMFYPYKPSYFGLTSACSEKESVGDIKFQISLKYEWLKDSDFYFGYTQKSFWSFFNKESAPFRESNFSPEFFYVDRVDQPFIPALKFLSYGIMHESSGEDATGSRSWNLLYITPSLEWEHYYIELQLWRLFYAEEENRDILDYYGYGELRMAYGISRKNQLSLTFRKGKRSDAFGLMAQYDIQLKSIFRSVCSLFGSGCNSFKTNPNIFFQLWNGYGESLKSYNLYRSTLTMGLSFII